MKVATARPFFQESVLLLHKESEEVPRVRLFAAGKKEVLAAPPLVAPAEEIALPEVELQVMVEYRAEFGQVLRMLWWENSGSSGKLERGVTPMTWSDGDVWQCRLVRPKRSFVCFRFELVVDKVNAVIRREFLGHPGYRTHDFVCAQTVRAWWDSTACQIVPPIPTTTNSHCTV